MVFENGQKLSLTPENYFFRVRISLDYFVNPCLFTWDYMWGKGNNNICLINKNENLELIFS